MRLLLIGDNKKEAHRVRKIFPKKEFQLQLEMSGWIESGNPLRCDAILFVVDHPKTLSPKIVREIRRRDDNLPVLVVASMESVHDAVGLMKEGIFDFFTAPIDSERLLASVRNAIRTYQLTKRIFLLENQLGAHTRLDQMVGQSAGMQTLFSMIRNVASTDANVLIVGESGTGKELVAKAIHRVGNRNARRFIDINCGAIPRELLENELFGHERGAFTGADKRYIGCCERADGGTLFLDEISELDLSLQVKLLRFLQERQFYRVGGNESIRVDTRIIAATNRDLKEQVRKGAFREDLFYRLNVVLLPLPVLRDRKEDIPILARAFLEKYNHRNEKIFLDFEPEVMELFLDYSWPGNIRELENVIERAIVLHNDTKIKTKHLPIFLLQGARTRQQTPSARANRPESEGQILPLNVVERYAIEAALKLCTGNVSKAARSLKIGQATLYRKIKEYGIEMI